ncbi:MAG: DUF2064 domain-containing protein [Planctomycetota bacterium]
MTPSERTGVGLAIFVKTPGLSPLKTRLAADVGRETADRFYELSLRAVAAVAAAARDRGTLAPYWAVAEDAALDDDRWAEFETLSQGEGELGERIDTVYRRLLSRHRAAVLVGADMPHLPLETLSRFAAMADGGETEFAMLPADDGGFVLFAGTREIPTDVWRDVPYSVTTTADRLLDELGPLGRTYTEHPAFDVDDGPSFRRLASVTKKGLLDEQAAVIDFCRDTNEIRPVEKSPSRQA